MTRIGTTKKDVDNGMELLKSLVAKAPLAEEKRKQIEKDLDGMARDLKKYIPELGAQVSVSFLTERGFEGYAYDYSEQLVADGSKPLTLLDHVGGSPILAAVGRSKYDPSRYQT